MCTQPQISMFICGGRRLSSIYFFSVYIYFKIYRLNYSQKRKKRCKLRRSIRSSIHIDDLEIQYSLSIVNVNLAINLAIFCVCVCVVVAISIIIIIKISIYSSSSILFFILLNPSISAMFILNLFSAAHRPYFQLFLCHSSIDSKIREFFLWLEKLVQLEF